MKPTEKKSCATTKPGRKQRRIITMATKIDIINRSEKGDSAGQIAQALGLPRTTVITILKDKTRIRQHVKETVQFQSCIITKKRSGLIAQMEKLLLMWIEDKTQRNMPLSLAIITEKAKSIYEHLKQESADDDVEPFKGSRGWFNRFKARSNLHNITVQGEAAGADSAAANTFPGEFLKIFEEDGYSARQVFNVDETGLFWKRMPNRTYIAKEEKAMPGFKASKDRLTLLLGGNAAGDFKLKPLLIYNSENPRCLKNHSKSSLPVIWRSGAKAWMTCAIFKDWFLNYFVPAVEKYCQENNLAFKALLILDNAPGHPVDLDSLHPNVKVVYLPPNTTSLLQPMDQGVIASFKAYYLRRTYAMAIKAIDTEGGPTLREFWKKYNILDAVNNIKASWDEVTPSNMNGVWRQLCPDLIFDFEGFSVESTDSVVKNVVEMGERLNLDISADDVNELLNSHHEELSVEDLVQLDKEVGKECASDDETLCVEETPVKVLTRKLLSDAFSHLDAAMAIFQQNDPDSDRSSSVNRGICNMYQCYKELYAEKANSSVQTSLNQFFK